LETNRKINTQRIQVESKEEKKTNKEKIQSRIEEKEDEGARLEIFSGGTDLSLTQESSDLKSKEVQKRKNRNPNLKKGCMGGSLLVGLPRLCHHRRLDVVRGVT
jgi:chromosome segregation and condensation protein ScpB